MFKEKLDNNYNLKCYRYSSRDKNIIKPEDKKK